MWDRLRQADIEQARQTLELRRAEVLVRHAREIDELAATQAEIDDLHELIAAFALKFKPAARIVDEGPPPSIDEGQEDTVVADEPAAESVGSSDIEIAVAPAEPAAEEEPLADELLPAVAQAGQTAPMTRRAPPPPPAPGDTPRTNFEVFRRAMSKFLVLGYRMPGARSALRRR